MSFAADNTHWTQNPSSPAFGTEPDEGEVVVVDFSDALDAMERSKLPVYLRAAHWIRNGYNTLNARLRGPQDFLQDEIREETPDFTPLTPARALFNEDNFPSVNPPGISTPVTGLLILFLCIFAWAQMGFSGAVFAAALGALLTSMYVLSTGRASWARVPAKRQALMLLGGSAALLILGKLISG